jgi:branched-chain amino acid aminotransferase
MLRRVGNSPKNMVPSGPASRSSMMDEGIIYLNGAFVPESEAKVSILDRGFNGGEGVYDVTRTFGGKPFGLKEHIDRLYRSLRYCRIDCDVPPGEMANLCLEVLSRNKHFLGPDDDFAIWNVVSRGVHQAGITQKASGKPTVAVFCIPVAFESFARHYVEGVKVMTPSTRRTPPQSLEAKAKITNKMNHVIALHEAKLVDPHCIPLMLDTEGNISETHMGNFFFVSQGKLHTPHERTVLGGVTRTTLFRLAAEMDIPVIEGDYTPYDVYSADEAFTSSTSPTIGPVQSLNGIAIGDGVPGPITLSLIKAWNKMVGIDIVSQALSHLADRDKQRALGTWEKLRDG